jgi:hypothetical protein
MAAFEEGLSSSPADHTALPEVVAAVVGSGSQQCFASSQPRDPGELEHVGEVQPAVQWLPIVVQAELQRRSGKLVGGHLEAQGRCADWDLLLAHSEVVAGVL